MRQMGYLSAKSFAYSSLGRLMLRLVLGDARRLLDTLPSAHRLTTSAGECKVRWTGHTSRCLRDGEAPRIHCACVADALAGQRIRTFLGMTVSPGETRCRTGASPVSPLLRATWTTARLEVGGSRFTQKGRY
jgi:hypothetical protein